MRNKKHKFPVVNFILYIISVIVLMVEAAIPGEQSAEQSNAVGNTLADFFNHVEGDQTVAIPPESLTITNKIDKGFVGETYSLSYEISPNDSTYKSVIFSSSNNDVASISNDGKISFLSVGTATISVVSEHYPNISDFFDISVYNIEATSISSSILEANLIDECYTLYFGKEYTIKTIFTPENTTIKDVSYVYNEKYIEISNEGVITPINYSANKEIEIKVQHNSLESIIKVKVDYENIVMLSSFSLDIPNNQICVNQQITPKVNINPSNATFSDYILVSSNDNIIKINKDSIIGVSEGISTITVKSNIYEDIYESIEIEVLPQPELIDFNITTKSLFIEDEVKLDYKLVPNYAKKPESVLYESLNSSIASINENGIIKGLSTGVANIKVTFNSIVKIFEINVKSSEITGNEDFEINVKNEFLCYGQEYLISDVLEVSSWYPDIPKDTSLSYSLQNDSNGVIKEKTISLTNLGNNFLYVTHNYTNITKVISLNCVDYNYLILDSNNNTISNIDIKVNEVFNFYISDTQSINNIYQTYEVSSSNNNVVTVNKIEDAYQIKSIDEGYATINVKSVIDEVTTNNLVINVSSQHIYTSSLINHLTDYSNNEEIIINDEGTNIYVNEKYSLNTFTSIDTTKSKIRYTSSNPEILTINSNGEINCKRIGTSVIKIYDELSNLSKEITFNVHNYIKLNSEEPFVIKGENLEILGDLYYAMTNGFSGSIKLNFDQKSTYTEVSYTSSDESVAVVGKDGIITPFKEGETTITITCDDGFQPKIEFDIKLKIKRQDYIKNLTDFLYDVRKGLGHFSAFLILGIFSTFTWLLIFRGKKMIFSIPINYVSGFIIAGVSELIQVYVPGRCGVFDDVMLDYEGFLISSTIITILIIIHQIKTYKRKKKQDI